MKVYPDKLAGALDKKTEQVYIVSGDEPLLVQENCDLIRAVLRKKGFIERDLFHIENAGFDWTNVLYAAGSMSLFAEQKLIELRFNAAKPGDKGSKALLELVEQLSDDTVLLIVMPRIDAAAQRSKWFKALDASGAFVQVWPIEVRELPRWVNQRLNQSGIKASREAVQLLASRTEGNLLAAIQEIERLKLANDGKVLDIEDVVASVADSARYDVFGWIDTVLSGDLTRALRMTSGLEAEGVEILFAVNMLARELRSLESMKMSLESGEALPGVLKKARVWDKRAPAVKRCLQQHTLRSLRQLQDSLGSIDRMVKGIAPGDPWRELSLIIQRLAGINTLISGGVSAGASAS